ncbi:ABC transporter permease [Cytophagaceae bacterium ABcell3]|nr:ABC transporter permease [Cytophagaceae bacterium ABcell3]
MKEKFIQTLTISGFGWSVPFFKIFTGEVNKEQLMSIWRGLGIPVVSIFIFLLLWGYGASKIDTSLGKVPGPIEVYAAAQGLYADHLAERAKKASFNERQAARNQAILASNPNAQIKVRDYAGKPTYLDQIWTSLLTVFAGFTIASCIAIPLGLICGMSRNVMAAFNPLIQVFKPVSPLAWLPIVTMIVSALYVSNDGWFAKSFIISAITVSLCSLWPGLINTALGVASIDKDYLNVAKVLKLSPLRKTFKIVLPASMPLIFAGLRISLGVGWMVLIAAEMLAQNPGLGKFVWDEFQNGSSQSLARIMVAVFTVGIVGFALDRVMVMLQKLVSFKQVS